MGCFIYGGVDLSTTFEVLEVRMPAIPTATADLRRAVGGDGAALAGSTLEPLDITVKCRMTAASIDPRDVQKAWADAVAAIWSRTPKALSLTTGRQRMAILAGETPLEFRSYSAIGELTFTCPDPVAYGETKTVTVPSGGSLQFTVGGTYPTRPTVTASAVRNSTSHVWGIRLDGGDYLHIETGSSSSRDIVADCAARTLTIASSPALPTLDSDWLELAPGTHTLAMDNGTGAATVTYSERWL